MPRRLELMSDAHAWLLARCEGRAHTWMAMRNSAGEVYRRCAECSMLLWD